MKKKLLENFLLFLALSAILLSSNLFSQRPPGDEGGGDGGGAMKFKVLFIQRTCEISVGIIWNPITKQFEG